MIRFWLRGSNGASISLYNLDLNEANANTNAQAVPYVVVLNKQQNCEYLIENLLPDTIYR